MSRGKRSRPSVPAARASSPAPARGRGGRASTAPAVMKAPRAWLLWALVGIAVVAFAAALISIGNHASRQVGSAGATPADASARAPVTAPAGSFTRLGGSTGTVSSLRGQATLLWFVTTWCSSCQAGTQAMSVQIPRLAADHVRVVELELSGDLGQPGPSMSDFARQLAGRRFQDADWTFGSASASLTQAYDPHGYLDVYYLINAAGQITYVNSSPASTMSQLLGAAAKVASHA